MTMTTTTTTITTATMMTKTIRVWVRIRMTITMTMTPICIANMMNIAILTNAQLTDWRTDLPTNRRTRLSRYARMHLRTQPRLQHKSDNQTLLFNLCVFQNLIQYPPLFELHSLSPMFNQTSIFPTHITPRQRMTHHWIHDVIFNHAMLTDHYYAGTKIGYCRIIQTYQPKYNRTYPST